MKHPPRASVYNYKYTPPKIPPPPIRHPSNGNLINWSSSGIALNANAWLCQHNHSWEFGEKYKYDIRESTRAWVQNIWSAHWSYIASN